MTEVYEVENSIDGPILEQIQVDTTDAIAAKRVRQLEGIKRSKAKYYQSIKEKPEFLERIAKNSKIYVSLFFVSESFFFGLVTSQRRHLLKKKLQNDNPVYGRRVNSFVLVCSLSSHRHSYIPLIFGSRFIDS